MSPESGGNSDDPDKSKQNANGGENSRAEPENSAKVSNSNSPPYSPNLAFEILKNQRRRYVLRYLSKRDDPVQLSELSEQIAAWENDIPITDISAAERKRVYTALYQSQLPLMDNAGIIEYNQNQGFVKPNREAISDIERYVSIPASEFDSGWERTTNMISSSNSLLQGSSIAANLLISLVLIDAIVVLMLPGGPVVNIIVLAMPLLIFGLFIALISERRSMLA